MHKGSSKHSMAETTWNRAWPPAALSARVTLVLPADPESDRVAEQHRVPAPDEDALDVSAAQSGDPQAFRALVERHQARAHQLAWRMLRSAADAEEVTQDAFVRAWRSLPAFRGEARFATWLHRIVARLALDRIQVLSRRRHRETDLEAASHVAAAATAGEPDEKSLDEMIASLSPAQQAVVRLFYGEDHSVATVAEWLEMPENTVKTHLSRARQALRAQWGEEERES
jgi:RNA polymerase sigma-70 factor (ECF subfamily)